MRNKCKWGSTGEIGKQKLERTKAVRDKIGKKPRNVNWMRESDKNTAKLQFFRGSSDTVYQYCYKHLMCKHEQNKSSQDYILSSAGGPTVQARCGIAPVLTKKPWSEALLKICFNVLCKESKKALDQKSVLSSKMWAPLPTLKELLSSYQTLDQCLFLFNMHTHTEK